MYSGTPIHSVSGCISRAVANFCLPDLEEAPTLAYGLDETTSESHLYEEIADLSRISVGNLEEMATTPEKIPTTPEKIPTRRNRRDSLIYPKCSTPRQGHVTSAALSDLFLSEVRDEDAMLGIVDPSDSGYHSRPYTDFRLLPRPPVEGQESTPPPMRRKQSHRQRRPEVLKAAILGKRQLPKERRQAIAKSMRRVGSQLMDRKAGDNLGSLRTLALL